MIAPILSALRRHKAGVVLIVLQIALTLAVVCNALFIIHVRMTRLSQPTGMTEDNLVAIRTDLLGDQTNFLPLIKADINALRAIPGVADAYATNSFPLRGGGSRMSLRLSTESRKPVTNASMYFADEHAINVLGAKLVAGRNFTASEIDSTDTTKLLEPKLAILTQALAARLFPGGSPLGKTFYFGGGTSPIVVVGIVERLQVPWAHANGTDITEYSMLLPVIANSDNNSYLIRTRAGEAGHVLDSVMAVLARTNRMRTMPGENPVAPFSLIRARAYEGDRGMAILLSLVSVILLAITAAGIAGLSSFWVGQRRRQIGVRRALGAKKRDILCYFLTENLLITGGGVLVGSVVAIALSVWMQVRFAADHLPLVYVLSAVALLLALGQVSVFAPALRASRVSPAEATRAH